MNILIIPSWYVGQHTRNNGSFFREQALALSKIHNVYILDVTLQSRENYFSRRNFHFKKYQDETLTVYSFTIPAFGMARKTKLCLKASEVLANKVMKKILKDNLNIDVIHAHSYFPGGYVACKLGIEYNIPVVVTEHSGSIVNNNLDEEKSELLTYTVSNADAFVCVSNKLRDCVIDLTKTSKKIYVVPNMVSDLFKYSPRKKKSTFHFISIGNLVKSKNHLLLCKLFANTFDEVADVRLEIIGKGPCQEEIESYIATKGLQHKIELLGAKSRSEVYDALIDCDCFILISDFESFGIAYIEALAVGRPVIGTKNGGANDIIRSTNGFLVDKDEASISNAMKLMYKESSSFAEKTISDECCENFSGSKISEMITEIYDIIIKCKN